MKHTKRNRGQEYDVAIFVPVSPFCGLEHVREAIPCCISLNRLGVILSMSYCIRDDLSSFFPGPFIADPFKVPSYVNLQSPSQPSRSLSQSFFSFAVLTLLPAVDPCWQMRALLVATPYQNSFGLNMAWEQISHDTVRT